MRLNLKYRIGSYSDCRHRFRSMVRASGRGERWRSSPSVRRKTSLETSVAVQKSASLYRLDSSCGLLNQSHTRTIHFPVFFRFRSSQPVAPHNRANFGIGTLAAAGGRIHRLWRRCRGGGRRGIHRLLRRRHGGRRRRSR